MIIHDNWNISLQNIMIRWANLHKKLILILKQLTSSHTKCGYAEDEVASSKCKTDSDAEDEATNSKNSKDVDAEDEVTSSKNQMAM